MTRTASKYGGFEPFKFDEKYVDTFTVAASNQIIGIGDPLYSDSDGKVSVITAGSTSTYAQWKAFVGIALEPKADSAAGTISVYKAMPGAEFVIQADDALAVTNTFNTIDFTNGGTSYPPVGGFSSVKADASSVGTTQVFPAMITGFVTGPESEAATAYQKIKVIFGLGRFIGSTGLPAV